MSGQFHAPAALPPGERAPGTHWKGGWMTQYGLNDVEKIKIFTLPGIEPGRPAWSLYLYRLRYPGFSLGIEQQKMLRSPCNEFSKLPKKFFVSEVNWDHTAEPNPAITEK
jgi:hypothetical protein